MAATKAKQKSSKRVKPYTYLGCPLTRNRSPWCFRLCGPDAEGKGRCGRLAPHTLKGRTQLSIEKHNKELLAAHCAKLCRQYLAAPCNSAYGPAVTVTEGAAEIVVPVQPQVLDAAGAVDPSVCFKVLNDAASLAVGSAVADRAVVVLHFSTYLTPHATVGELVGRGRLMGTSADLYLAEAVLTDREGNEVGRGNGTLRAGTRPLSAETGHE
ncbi:MAG: hypothetical protein COZ06_28850 [Armatimonadetes bacterium CG_4_10_14_3_um_filter_66_18]|nr:hypothetical protein [Armatimonadota bacterium]PIU91081.1 MAG: hypothetical protein COS65_23045 [Armatimonadetes bacterium CG06_land_8_20_14_3_00_66_21]PIX44505.1 MAG: hypothetical protein COZ57_17295 [Armatimonadetes bacterium CG_4_8_14_3_um_filter_66_20]PIY39931.1 MAG: hypothetical protein COZ06_28850 [Armatimonadetes bacterium CG_4_10_14_3_um_filter_66_18]PIZ46927.1 MAG: hypothetical protein COY42_09595 [Armatimonadetes bacterium CG_4_10_14_0_8_um_filter_66_14]PJB66083.1 MAG: hypothetica